MIITKQNRENSPELKKLYNRLTITNAKIRDRVLNPLYKQYKDYGGRGITLDKKWETISGFVDDVDKIPGWDQEKYIKGEIELDKDIRYPGNKHYSKETCLWVSHKENMQVLPSVQKPFYAYNEYTGEIHEGLNQNKFSELYQLGPTGVNACLRGIKHRVGDYWIWFKGSSPKGNPIRYYYKDESGKITWDVNPRRLSIKLGKNDRYINSLLVRQKSVKKSKVIAWKKEVDLISLVKEYELSKIK